jgi:hypothetical protein
MSPFSGLVLGSAAVVGAPALWSSLVLGTTPIADGLLRYVVAVLVCWVGLSVVVAMVGPVPTPTQAPSQPGTSTDHTGES